MRADARRPAQPDRTGFWLDELKEAHESLLSAIEKLAQLTRGPLPDKGELAAVRWRVSAASLSITQFCSQQTPVPSCNVLLSGIAFWMSELKRTN